MADIVDAPTRSKMMAAIKGKDTAPELEIRRLLHGAGFRYRLHYSSLPGKPDIVLPKHRAIILVNGCFWHQHNCHLFKLPSTRQEFWQRKLQSNKSRDQAYITKYKEQGWRVLIVWECALKGKRRISSEQLASFLKKWIADGAQFDELPRQSSDLAPTEDL